MTDTSPDVPTQVFSMFLENLKDAGVPDAVIARLRKTLLEERSITEGSLTQAVLRQEPPQ